LGQEPYDAVNPCCDLVRAHHRPRIEIASQQTAKLPSSHKRSRWPKTVRVKSYKKKNGTVVKAHNWGILDELKSYKWNGDRK